MWRYHYQCKLFFKSTTCFYRWNEFVRSNCEYDLRRHKQNAILFPEWRFLDFNRPNLRIKIVIKYRSSVLNSKSRIVKRKRIVRSGPIIDIDCPFMTQFWMHKKVPSACLYHTVIMYHTDRNRWTLRILSTLFLDDASILRTNRNIWSRRLKYVVCDTKPFGGLATDDNSMGEERYQRRSKFSDLVEWKAT